MTAAVRIASACLCIAILSSSLAQEETKVITRETLKDYLANDARNTAIYERQEKAIREEYRKAKRTRFSNHERRKQVIADLEAKLAEVEKKIKNPPLRLPRIYVRNISIGQVGVLRHAPEGVQYLYPTDDQQYTVQQVIDENSCIAEMNGERLWLTMPTEGMVDEKTYLSDMLMFEAVGTKTYITVLGSSKTIYHLKAMDIRPYLPQKTAEQESDQDRD